MKYYFTIEITKVPFINGKQYICDGYTLKHIRFDGTIDEAMERFNKCPLNKNVRCVSLAFSNIDTANTKFPYLAEKYNKYQVVD